MDEGQFAITFPNDIDFEIFCYFVNYLVYPLELKWTVNLTGWATAKQGDTWIKKECINKKLMLFIPQDDTEYDNVYMTTDDNIGYKLGFAAGRKANCWLCRKNRLSLQGSTSQTWKEWDLKILVDEMQETQEKLDSARHSHFALPIEWIAMSSVNTGNCYESGA